MRHAILALIAGAVAGTARAQVTLETANLSIPGYYGKLKAVVDDQIIGYRTVVERKQWDPLRKDDALTFTFDERRDAVHGKSLWVSRITFPPSRMPSGVDGRDKLVHVVSPDDFYYLHREKHGGYTVEKHGTEWGDPQGYSGAVGQYAAMVQLFQPRQVKEVLETADDEFEGRPTLRITLRTQDGEKRITHVDRKTYQHLYSESDKVLDLKRRGRLDGKTVLKTDYREEGGKLWPTHFEQYQVLAGGTKQPWIELTFVEYAPYAPSDDELDLEKQFGIKPIPHEPRPDSAQPRPMPAAASRAGIYFAAAGVLALAAAGLVALRLRRRTPPTE